MPGLRAVTTRVTRGTATATTGSSTTTTSSTSMCVTLCRTNYKIMIYINDIIEAYKVARKNKRRSVDSVIFELHWEAKCLNLYNDIINHTLHPTAYTFVVDYPKYREIFASDLQTRILHHYIDIRLRPLLEKRLSDHTFNNRKGYGQNACQNAVISDVYEVSRGYTSDAWVIKADLKGCFPNIIQDIAYAQLEEVIVQDYHGYDKDELIYILKNCIFSYPTLHCTRIHSKEKWKYITPEKSLFSKELGIGAPIGHLIWQNAVNYYFNDIDKWILSLGIKYERFVDDMYFITDNKVSFLSYVLPELRIRLATLGAKINENKHYCQHYSKGFECLGVHVKMDRVYPNTRIIRKGKYKAKQFNKVRSYYINDVLSSINSYLGICKNLNGYHKADEIIRSLNPKWTKYLYYDRESMTLKARPQYNMKNRLKRKYYDTKRKKRTNETLG